MDKKNIISSFCFVFALILIFVGLDKYVLHYQNKSGQQSLTQQNNFNILDRPNIVLINIDSLRADHMGVYGYDKNTTPFLDSLFQKGIVFENAIAVAPFTFQDDASILSGLYPSQNNVTDWGKPINKSVSLLPKILSYYGYSTMAFVSPSLWESFEMNKFFDTYVMNRNMKNVAQTKVSIAEKLKEAKGPFFAFWHIYDVHLPYVTASEEFYPKKYEGSLNPLSKYFAVNVSEESKGELPPLFTWSGQTKEGLCISYSSPDRTCKKYVKINPEDKEYIRAAYDTGINYVDTQLSKFFDLIKNEPFFENTLFIISAEHGEDLGEHGLFFHGDIYNTNTHVPLALIHPKLASEKINGRVSNIDILPTTLSLLGIAESVNIEGKDLSGLIGGGTYENRIIFSERPPFNEYSVISGDWKYIMRNPLKSNPEEFKEKITPFMTAVLGSDSDTNSTDELYNLSNDPYEQNNLIGRGYKQERELRQLVQDFNNKMTKAREDQELGQPSAPPQTLIPYP